MKLYLSLCLLAVVLSLNTSAQTNAGMPLVREVGKRFFTIYASSEASTYYKFEKRVDGWWVSLYRMDSSRTEPGQLFWDKKNQRYLDLVYPHRSHPDPDMADEELANYATRSYLTDRQMEYYGRDLYYGYDDWCRDVMQTLEASPPSSDSLLEALANAYGAYSFGFIDGSNALEEDADRRPLADSVPFPRSRMVKYASFAKKSVDTYRKVYLMNSHYRCLDYDIRARMNSEAMTAWDLLNMVGGADLRAPFLAAVSFPDSELEKARRLLEHVKPRGIVFTNGDTSLYPLLYLQSKGVRQDVMVLEYTMLLLKRNLVRLDKQYGHTLFAMKRSVYLDPAFMAAYSHPEYKDAPRQRVDSFFKMLYSSPGSKELPQLDSSFGRVYLYYTRQVYFPVNVAKAKNFYPGDKIAGGLRLNIPESYMLVGDLVQMDIIQRYLLNRHIYFTNLTEQPMFTPSLLLRGAGIWELAPLE